MLIIHTLIFYLFYDSVVGQTRQQKPLMHQDDANRSVLYSPSNMNSFGQIEYRLTRLEVQVAEKSEVIRSELRETGRRMQGLEWQNAEVRTSLDALKGELSRFTEQTHSTHPRYTQNENVKLEEKFDNLVKGVQLVVVAIRSLTFDIHALKTNVSALLNKTEAIHESHKHLVTKRFFNSGIAELKYERVYNPQLCSRTDLSDAVKSAPRNCKEIQARGGTQSGIYRIKPEHSAKPFMVFCDLDTKGGGWTYIMNRFDGTEDFYLNWHDYKYGFGNIGGESWLGLENIHQLTGHEINELYVELQDLTSDKAYAHYGAFSVGPEMEGYPMKVLGAYNGTAGDSFMYHAGSKFSTKDMDQDSWPEGSCAQAHGGGWWYRACDKCNLNGRYLSGDLPDEYIYQGMYWGDFRGPKYSLLSAKMMIRPAN